MKNKNSEYAADCIFYNARVITLDPSQPFADFIATKGNKIIGVGRRDELDQFNGTDTKRIDCDGGTVIPGFNDAHCHPLSLGATMVYVDCSKEAVKDIDDIKKQIHQRAKKTEPGKWIRAANYDEVDLSEKRAPNCWDLNEAAPKNPVILVHRYGHVCVLNSMALQIAGIDNQAKETSTGTIHRDSKTKRPSGMISGRNEQVERAIPPLDDYEMEEGMKLANDRYLSFGITSLQDTSWTNGLYHWQKLKYLIEKKILHPRLTMLAGTESFEDFHKQGLTTGSGNCRLRLGGVKIALDESTGCIHPPQEEINQVALMAQKASFQLAFHASDIYMLQTSLKAMEVVLASAVPKYDHCHRLEHCAVCPPGLLPQIKKSNAIIVSQPAFLYYNGQRYLNEVSPSQLKWVFPFGSYNKNGIQIAFGSDSPVVPSNPLTGIYAAVTRKVENGQILCQDEGISVIDALRMYTICGAYASFEEGIKGSICKGKLADMVILNNDPTQIAPEEIMDLKVIRTIIDGEIMWDRDNADFS